MKKFAAVLAVLMSLSMTGIAAETSKEIDITHISSDEGLISIETVNGLKEDTIFTLTVVKEGDLSLEKMVYCSEQQKVKAGSKATFKFIIPDERDGVIGSGSYKVTLSNKSRNKDEETFEYADRNAINQFFTDLKTAAEGVTDPTKAYEAFEPLITEGIVFSIGIDYEQYSQKSEAIRNNTLNVLYANGVDKLSAETLPKEFVECFAVSVYNSGEKTEGLEILSLKYNGKAAEEGLLGEAAGIMSASYQKSDEFKAAATDAYGLTTVNNANSGNIAEVLSAYKTETGKCDDIINKINALSGKKKIAAYDYIILSLSSSKVKTSVQLDNLLKAAYADATSGGTTGLGGGGGAVGGSGGRTPVNSGSVSTTTGSGGIDEKEEATVIFSDLPVDHWAAESVKQLKEKGIISGTDTGAFEPDRYVTREEFAKMLVLACGISTENADTVFEDAVSGAWYRPYIGVAAENGIVKGIGDNKFGVGQTITRQDMAVMTARALKLKGAELSQIKEYVPFDDEADIADYAIEDVKLLFEAGVINGKGLNIFDPNGNATRAEAAKIIYEAFRGEW